MALSIRIATTFALAMVVAATLSARVLAANVLLQGYYLNPGGALVNGAYTFIMQNDCNLVLYKNSQPLWSTVTYNRGTACFFTLQFDGNAVLYTGLGVALFSTNTYGLNDGSHYIILQSDGNVVMYNGSGTPIWATGTNGLSLTQIEPLDAATLESLQHAKSAGVLSQSP
ncbi:hypothetical protein KP509_27G050400 [Ceratopteris richardii]|uniref:Bulb-type lectin domain-containing protein n=1 Tax=Ceratopteris richardii TaxID=49495 RepID=A0A8T2RIS2_CERRI|nr:hypothetical protein KP509_27G050300 [Ceratopteris richardii]KAH7295478.1 hypothetical protein KP509_27G050400 [Ceratopteris richardii]